jgi:hypothetical protein
MTAQEAVEFLAGERRAVLLGGLAVILHGLSRNTKDYDIWLDPLPDVQAWAAPIQQLLTLEPSLQAQRISAFGGWQPISVGDVPVVGAEDRLIRIAGAERPIDVFFVANELEAADFEGVWERGTAIDHGVRLIEAIDLIVTKQLTDRPHDETDIRFLTHKIEAEYRSRLRACSEAEAVSMLDRFATPEIAAIAVRESKEDSIRAIGWKILHEMRDNGDPFAEEFIREIVRERQVKAEELLRKQRQPPEQDQGFGPLEMDSAQESSL